MRRLLRGKTLMSFKDFPPRQKPASFPIDQALEKMPVVGVGFVGG